MPSTHRWERVLPRLEPLGAPFTTPPAPRPPARRRDPGSVLARARVLSMVSTVAEGYPAEEVLPDVERFHVESMLAPNEAALLHGEIDGDADMSWQVEAAMALAWSLGLCALLGPTDPEAPGPIEERLMDEGADASVVPCADEELLEELVYLDAYHAGYERMHSSEAPPMVVGLGPQHGPLALESVRWRRAALAWAVDDTTSWPP